jgi:hypothetical protein
VWLPLIAVAFAIVVALVLFAPVGVEVLAAKTSEDTAFTIQARFHWLGFSFRVGGTGRTRAKERHREAPHKRTRFGLRSVLAVLRSPGFVSRCTKLMKDVGRLALPGRLNIQGRVGFDDPADTGMFLGWLYAFPEAHGPRRAWHVHVEPDFSGPVIEGSLLVAWSRSLASVGWPVLTFMTSPVVWRAWRRGRRAAA